MLHEPLINEPGLGVRTHAEYSAYFQVVFFYVFSWLAAIPESKPYENFEKRSKPARGPIIQHRNN